MIDQLIQQVTADALAAREVTDTVKAALAALAQSLPSDIWRKRKTGWHRTHYADCNAAGENKYHYEDRSDTITVRGYSKTAEGGQNGGSYALSDDDDSLYFTRGGRLETAVSVEGSWSQWQGSSSEYEVSFAEAHGSYTDEALQQVVAKVGTRLEEYRANKIAKHAAGAAYARQLLAALAAMEGGTK
jgi:hypothetical protein